MLRKVFAVPYMFTLLSLAPVAGLFCYLRGKRLGIWNSTLHRH